MLPTKRGIQLSSTIVTGAMLFWVSAAQAQTAPQTSSVQTPLPPDTSANAPAAEGASGQASQIQDIVVYAQKGARGESVQHTPIAMTAVSGALIDQVKATDIVEIGRIAPNVSFTQASTLPGFANFTIRGVGVGNSTPTVDPAVNLVVDGMVYDFQGATVIDAFDLESVEILRGPQGILFGKNSTGGAVSVRTRRPTNDFEARGEITGGNLNHFDVSASVSGPIVKDTLLAKIAVLYRSQDGAIYDNNGGTFVPTPINPTGTQPATEDGRIGNNRTLIVRPTITFKPTSALTLNLLGEYLQIKGGGSPSQTVPGYDAPLQTAYGYTPPAGKFEDNVNDQGLADIHSERIVGELNWNVGPGVITSVTGYRHVDYDFQFDADGTPFIIMEFPKGNTNKSNQFSEELRFASTFSNSVDFVAGAYYDHHDLDVQEVRLESSTLLGDLSAPGTIYLYRGFYTQKATSYAAFGNIRWKVTPKLSLIAGGRYTRDEKSIDFVPFQRCSGTYGPANTTLTQAMSTVNLAACPNAATEFSNTWSKFSPKLGIDYNFSDDVLAYASWTNGFRSGNYNGRGTSLEQVGPADPETVSSYEAGLKTTFLGGRARVNIAAFYSDYKDIQLTVRQGLIQVLANAAAGTIKGVELETSFKPVKAIELTGNFGWTDAKYDSFTTPIPGLTVDQSLSKKFIKVPEFTAYGAAAYYATLGDANLTARVSYSWEDSSYLDSFNSPFAYRAPHGYLDANLTVQRGAWTATLFARNLTNTHSVDQVNTIFVPTSYGSYSRTYGVTVGFKF